MRFVRGRTQVLPVIAILAMGASACSDISAPSISSPPADTARAAPPPHDPAMNTANPFAGVTLYVERASNAQAWIDTNVAFRPADAAAMARIASQPQAEWLGDWNMNIRQQANDRVTTIANSGALPVFVAYDMPQRDCGLYAAGGAASPEAYKTWIRELASGIGSRKAIVILEPDALANMDCLSAAEQNTRIGLLRDAVQVLKAQGNIAVYIDAGNTRWQPAATIASRLQSAGVANADGFALNVSNFQTNADNITYGDAISAMIGGKHYVFDTSRNGLGPKGEEWCNPTGRGLGTAPTTRTGHVTVDAVLWIKAPGESDGTCGSAPAAGLWWASYALDLASRAVLNNPI